MTVDLLRPRGKTCHSCKHISEDSYSHQVLADFGFKGGYWKCVFRSYYEVTRFLQLKHYGVFGKKWGRRKSGGEDTTSSDYNTATVLKKKKLSEMSNEELKTLTARLGLERQYKDLTRSEISIGRKITNDMMMEVGKNIAKTYISKAGTMGIDAFLKKIGANRFASTRD